MLYLQLILNHLTTVLQDLVSTYILHQDLENIGSWVQNTRLVFKLLQINARSKSYQQNSVIRQQCGNHSKREQFQHQTNKTTRESGRFITTEG